MRRIVLLGATLLIAAAAEVTLAGAQGTGVSLPSDSIVAARQAGFDLQNGVAVAMKAGVTSGADVKQYTDGAKGILAWSKVIPTLFPAGTERGHDTKAKSEVWSDRTGFEKAAADLTTQAEKLVQLADANDKAGFAAQFTETGKACGACHRQYREK